MSDWQPIETAPTTGENLLGCWVKRKGVKGEGQMQVFYLDEAGNPYDNEGYSLLFAPSHWMPLPEGP